MGILAGPAKGTQLAFPLRAATSCQNYKPNPTTNKNDGLRIAKNGEIEAKYERMGTTHLKEGEKCCNPRTLLQEVTSLPSAVY